MRRKANTLLPIELSIIEGGIVLRNQGATHFHGFLIAKKIKERESTRLLTAHGTLYKALDRMEKAGLLQRWWEDPLIAAEEHWPLRSLYQVTVAGEWALANARRAEPERPMILETGGATPCSRFSMTLAVGLVRRWVRLYTLGMPAKLRDARRGEMESDLWEQEREAGATGNRPESTATHVFVRWFKGIPADWSWRLEQTPAVGHQIRGMAAANQSKGQVEFMGIAGLMAAFTILIGVLVSLGAGQSHIDGHDLPRLMWEIVGVSAGAVALVGLLVSRRYQLAGSMIALVATFPVAAILVWTILLPVLWLLLVMFVVVRALVLTRTRTVS